MEQFKEQVLKLVRELEGEKARIVAENKSLRQKLSGTEEKSALIVSNNSILEKVENLFDEYNGLRI